MTCIWRVSHTLNHQVILLASECDRGQFENSDILSGSRSSGLQCHGLNGRLLCARLRNGCRVFIL